MYSKQVATAISQADQIMKDRGLTEGHCDPGDGSRIGLSIEAIRVSNAVHVGRWVGFEGEIEHEIARLAGLEILPAERS
jgi:hypothetical protein